MICEHRAKESHTSIHLCQGGEGRAREKKGLDGGVWGAEGEGANGAPNHILHLRVILGVCIYIHTVHVCVKCRVVRVSQVLFAARVAV